MSIAALKTLLKRGRYDNDAMYDILMKQQQKGYTNLTTAEKAQYDQLYNIFGRDAMETMEDRLFHALGGKYPGLDDMVKGGKYMDDDALTNMFNRKIDTVIDDFAARADALKGRKNAGEESISLLEELLEEELPELFHDRKSINDMSGGFFADDMMTVDPEGRLDVLVDAVDDMYTNAYSSGDVPYMDASVVDELGAAMSPEYLAHNLRGTKRHLNSLPETQIKHKKKSGTGDDMDFWDEAYEYDIGDIRPRDKDLTDIRQDAIYDNVAKEGKYTPTEPMDPSLDAILDPSGKWQYQTLGSEERALRGLEASVEEVYDLETRLYDLNNLVKQEGGLMSNTNLQKLRREISEIQNKLKTIQTDIPKKAGGGIIDGPLYNRDF